MQLTQLDTRVPLSAEAPQINFNQLTADTLGLYDNIKQRGQQGILSRLLAQNTNAQGEVNLGNALAGARNQPYAPQLTGVLSSAIQAQNVAKAKAAQDALKFNADINKTYAETGKLSQEGAGKGLENSEKKFGAINQIFQTAALTGNRDNVRLGLNHAHRAGLIGQEDYATNMQALDVMTDEEVAQFAQGVSFSNAKDPSSYLFQTKNNIADNAQSDMNNQRTTQASIYGTEVGAQTAANKLTQDGEQFNAQQYITQNKPLDYFTAADGTRYAVYANGQGIPISDTQGNTVKVQQGKSETSVQKMERLERVVGLADSAKSAADASQLAAKLANDLKGLNSTAGGFGILAKIPGTPQRTYSSQIETLQSQVFLNQITKMKGMGALTDAEGQRLATSIANLDKGLEPHQLQANLTEIAKVMSTAAVKASKLSKIYSGGAGNKDTGNSSQESNSFSYFDD
ncbi:hypothetical protein ACK2M2_11165 [Acinetobacter sp. TY1]|uniref:hypothetical protein n=1 Tax=Acinetobacter sp. TY1 TaxID=3387626 RepID=UPI003AF8B6F1